MWYYRRTEANLWTVLIDTSDDEWATDSDHDKREDTANRVAYLNGTDEGLKAHIATLSANILALMTNRAEQDRRIVELQRDTELLEALKQVGVDNWGGYGEACDLLEEWNSEND